MSLLGRLRESRAAGVGYVLAQRLVQPAAGRRVMVFPDAMYTGSAGDLRAVAVGRALRRLDWRAVVVPPWLDLAARRRAIRAERPNVLLLQQTRHPLNRPALYDVPSVLDIDDADIVHPHHEGTVADCCRYAAGVVAGSRYLAARFRVYNPAVRVVWTGTYLTEVPGTRPNVERSPVVTWAHSDPLGYPDEAELVRDVLVRLAARCRFAFVLYGARDARATESYLAPIRAAGVPVRAIPPLRYKAFIRHLTGTAVGLHPVSPSNPFSQGKSFGKLLGYMAADVAVVTSNAVDHPLFFDDGRSARLVTEPDEWADACERLLTSPSTRGRMVTAARADFLRRLTTKAAAVRVGDVLARAASGTSGAGGS